MTAPIAAALGRTDRLAELLRSASADDVQNALGMAVINGQTDAARLALDAGADPNRFLPVHTHSLPLHQAALDENLELMELLVAHGARTDIADKLWNANTPRLGDSSGQGSRPGLARTDGAPTRSIAARLTF